MIYLAVMLANIASIAFAGFMIYHFQPIVGNAIFWMVLFPIFLNWTAKTGKAAEEDK